MAGNGRCGELPRAVAEAVRNRSFDETVLSRNRTFKPKIRMVSLSNHAFGELASPRFGDMLLSSSSLGPDVHRAPITDGRVSPFRLAVHLPLSAQARRSGRASANASARLPRRIRGMAIAASIIAPERKLPLPFYGRGSGRYLDNVCILIIVRTASRRSRTSGCSDPGSACRCWRRHSSDRPGSVGCRPRSRSDRRGRRCCRAC